MTLLQYSLPFTSVASGILLLIWILNLIRRGRLYVGYGAALILVVVALSPLFILLHVPVQIQLPVYAGVVVLVYLLNQLTIVSNRLATVIQELAIQRARDHARPQP